jgi:DNA-binding protein
MMAGKGFTKGIDWAGADIAENDPDRAKAQFPQRARWMMAAGRVVRRIARRRGKVVRLIRVHGRAVRHQLQTAKVIRPAFMPQVKTGGVSIRSTGEQGHDSYAARWATNRAVQLLFSTESNRKTAIIERTLPRG